MINQSTWRSATVAFGSLRRLPSSATDAFRNLIFCQLFRRVTLSLHAYITPLPSNLSPLHGVIAMSDDLSPSSPEVMNAFYRRLYPFKSVFKWLNHEHTPTRQWTNREIAYSLQNDVYLRYQSFANADEFKKQTCTLNPTRFEIGPVYSARVCVSFDFREFAH